jgi:hypothetical protein
MDNTTLGTSSGTQNEQLCNTSADALQCAEIGTCLRLRAFSQTSFITRRGAICYRNSLMAGVTCLGAGHWRLSSRGSQKGAIIGPHKATSGPLSRSISVV